MLSENNIYSEWWFYLLIIIGLFISFMWIMNGSLYSSASSQRKSRNYSKEYSDCNKAWELIHKNGWNADDFAKAQQLLADGHLKYTNNGDYII